MKKSFFATTTLIALSVLLFSSVAFAQATAPEAYERGKACYDNAKKAGLTAATKAKWEKCSDVFMKTYSAFPRDKKGIDALYSAAKVKKDLFVGLKDTADADEAIKRFNLLIKDHPESSLADDSLFEIAKLRHATGDDVRAEKALSHIISDYPKGDQAAKAKSMITALGASGSAAVVSSGDEEEKGDQEIKEEKRAAKKDVEKPAKEAIEPAQKNGIAYIRSVDLKESSGGAKILIGLSRKSSYTIDFTEEGMHTKAPPVLEIIIPHAEAAPSLEKQASFDSQFVSSMKVKRRPFGNGTRMIFTLLPETGYDVVQDGASIVVKLGESQGFDRKPKLADTERPKADSKKKESKKKRSG